MENIAALVADPAAWVALITLIAMELVLGIDNLIFISILTNKLPEQDRARARRIGVGLALLLRLALLGTVSWMVQLTTPVFHLFDHGFSWRDLILLAGGLFLLVKATQEIHKDVEAAGEEEANLSGRRGSAFGAVVAQIVVIDVVFSIDSIVTAVGIAEDVGVMIAAVIVAVAVMYAAAGAISAFIHRHPTTRMLALAFLLMIGFALVADGAGFHIPRGYLYVAMAFSTAVELLNTLAQRNRQRGRSG